jgi:cysteine synthase
LRRTAGESQESQLGRNLLSAIGNTPVAEIPLGDSGAWLLAKLEFFNPTGSLKDRIARYMVEKAEAAGRLKPGHTLLEATSGNTGIALAAVGAVKGYRVKIIMAENMSVERRKMISAFGAQVILTPAAAGSDGAIALAAEMARQAEHFLVGQFHNPDNVLAHYETTAVEILRQTPDLDTFVAGMGTGGTIMGVAKRLREEKPDVRIVGIEMKRGSRIQGLKDFEDFVPPILDFSVLDERVVADDEETIQATRRLAREHGIFAGISSGAVFAEALRQAQKGRRRIVGVFGDSGSRYLSTSLFQ